ncbi:Fe-S cluster assembly protein SufD [Macrococcus equipercicus]|uniref:Fe-S cluster assembly protein SufD n=1 Tax=Macrococcus equipercicus TaxID=69967 RepID=A0A9Q9BWK5_9STAP|nr:Fe-S cluster assembly protein SufD [Macrococcus equipercicus]KAA1042517.1 Fe-S cluster assembly protein SufD [Macrococcus equipercicus]UTH14378.1 Fe-S cluster assembly protein SufD [Macrococcus equipercicus]
MSQTFDVNPGIIQEFSQSKNEPSWMTAVREDAFNRLNTIEMPKPDKTKLDKWNFHSVKHTVIDSDTYASVEALPASVKQVLDIESIDNLYVQHNNTPALLKVSPELEAQGVIIKDIHTAMAEHSELVQQYFMTEAVKVDEHRLTALHAALMNGGLFIYVPKNVVIESPIQMVTLHDNADVNLFNHVLIVADESSEVTYVENYISTIAEAKAQLNLISEVIASNNAKITYGTVDFLCKGLTGHVIRRGVAAQDAVIDWALGLMNDGDTINDNTTYLMGDNSSSDLKIVVVGRGEQKLNFTTQIIQYGKNSQGHILKHGVMKDAASSIFNGIGYIKHGATKADAQQESRVLMLSEKSRGDANPILLIDEDDVTAGHAASAGRVDPLQLFYLMSRGISKQEAERLVIHGFLAPVVNVLPIEAVKRQLTEVIEQKVMGNI